MTLTGRSAAEVQETPATTAVPGSTLTIVITGAFSTALPLDIPRADYDLARQRMLTALPPEHGWFADSAETGGTYTSGGGFGIQQPTRFLSVGTDSLNDRLAACLGRFTPCASAPTHSGLSSDWYRHPTGARIDFYDLGVAVISARFDVQVSDDLTGITSIVKDAVLLKPTDGGNAPPLSFALSQLAYGALTEFAASAQSSVPESIDAAWRDLTLDRESSRQLPLRFLWLHPVFMPSTPASASSTGRPRTAEPDRLVDLFEAPFNRRLDIFGTTMLTGIGWTTILDHDPKATTPSGHRLVRHPLEILELHWSYIAAYMMMDRGLLELLDQTHRTNGRRLSGLEKDADRSFEHSMRVLEARARIDTTFAELGGDDQAIWECLAAVNKFDTLVQGVDRKIEALRRLTERRVQQAAARRAQRLSLFLAVLTSVTVVGVAAALVDYFVGSRPATDGHDPLRLSVAAVAAVGVFIAFLRTRRH